MIPVHGTVKAHLGKPEIGDLLGSGFDIGFDDLLLCVPEPAFGEQGHSELIGRLEPMWCFEPDFVAIYGYSFASLDPTSGLQHDDHECLRLFVERLRDYDGAVSVALPKDPSADSQRDEEAAIVARICRQLVGSIQVKRTDGSITPLTAGDIGLLTPTRTDLWRFERALEAEGLSVASQAGKTLFLQQETQDVLALLRTLADARDTLAFGAFMRGPMVGLTDEELLDITEQVRGAGDGEGPATFNVRTPLAQISNPVAKAVLAVLQDLRRRAARTTPRALLSEAIERLHLRVVLAARHGSRSARALANLDAMIEMARPYNVSGLRAFVSNLQSDWQVRAPRAEGRIDASNDAVEIVTIHSSKGLEWPVVIPINTSTEFPTPPQFIHRRSDNTLHWVLGGVMPPELLAAREEEKREQTLERQRMWYVACTRARDLLIIPHLPEASSQSWSKILNLGHASLPELDLTGLAPATAVIEPRLVNAQTAELFVEESRRMAAAAPALTWRTPSTHDREPR